MVVAAVAQEPLLRGGPPGTAKSTWCSSSRTRWASPTDYFEYMLTRFTEPSEIIGPIDINQLAMAGTFAARRASCDRPARVSG